MDKQKLLDKIEQLVDREDKRSIDGISSTSLAVLYELRDFVENGQ